MGDSRRLAHWLVDRRRAIDAALVARLGGAPAPRSPEAEALRRFRSWTVLRLGAGSDAAPSLDGLRVAERRMRRLLDAWVDACADTAGPDRAEVEAALGPLAERFRLACAGTRDARGRSGRPEPGRRRAVSAAIDRVSDAFLAVDVDSLAIVDANPAAGALLGRARDALIGAELLGFVPEAAHDAMLVELDAVAEGGEPRRAALAFGLDGRSTLLDASLTRFATRRRTLALVLLRAPAGDLPADTTPDLASPGARGSRDARAGTARGVPTRPLPPPGGSSPTASRS